MQTMKFRLAEPADAAALTIFAEQIFRTTFGPDNDPAHLEAYMAEAFRTEVQAAEIARPDTFTVLAVDADDHIAGYAYVALGAPGTVIVGAEPIEIKRFYVGSEHHGGGVAQAMMEEVLRRARALGARTIWLGVWEANVRAIKFYRKLGFVQAGTQRFLLGDDLQTDWVMQQAL